MKRHIPGLHVGRQATASHLEGMFLVRVDTASYRWHPQKPFLVLRFVILEPNSLPHVPSPGGCTAASEHFGSSIGFFGTSAMTPNCSVKIKWMRKRFSIFRESFELRSSLSTGVLTKTSKLLLLPVNGRSSRCVSIRGRNDNDLQPHTD